MEADFSGWATKAGLRCADGRTIMPNAFKNQDRTQVPLVWQHGHTKPENVLGHAILENREEGVYCYGFLNGTPQAQHTATLLNHKDVNSLSIWANELVERAGKVLHGVIREVSVVLSGANPGALIETVTIRHGDGSLEDLGEDEAIIFTGLELEHENLDSAEKVEHAAGSATVDDNTSDEETIEDVYNTLDDKQKQVVDFMVGEALAAGKAEGSNLQQDNLGANAGDSKDNGENAGNDTQEGTKDMTHTNVFEKGADEGTNKGKAPFEFTRSMAEGIMHDALKMGSLKDAVEGFCLSHGIDDIDVLFPEARTVGTTPEFNQRRTEWVADVLGAARKSPFSRIKTFSADITEDEARARGYIKGTLKKEEFFSVAKRVTTPTTVYKKQKLDRDDVVDITDFDVVAWLRAEMRLMLEEELARAILFGDGRDIASDDKINEGNIRPIASDHRAYVTTIDVNIDDANSSISEVVDAIVANRADYKGTGLPTMFTTETYIAKFLLLEDTVGRKIYKTLDEVATQLRVAKIVPVEAMEAEPDIVAILVNMQDYVVGADRGGNVSMFDDFDIDYNQYKYLIETRISGALVKLKSALVVRKTASNAVFVVPNEPSFDGTTITINATTGVTYKRSDTDATVTGTMTLSTGDSREIYATPNSGYAFASDADTSWVYRKRS